MGKTLITNVLNMGARSHNVGPISREEKKYRPRLRRVEMFTADEGIQ